MSKTYQSPLTESKKKESSKLKSENAELKRQIKFLGEICRRCNASGSTNMNTFQTGTMTKQSICQRCDITYCQYSGMTKEQLAEQKSTGASNTPIPPELMNSMNFGGGFGGFGGFMPY